MEEERGVLLSISQQDMEGKGNLGRPNPPGVSVEEMQRILDELSREVIVPAYNAMVELQNQNNTVLWEKTQELQQQMELRPQLGQVLTLDNQQSYTPTQPYHPATKLFVEGQVEAHQQSDLYHITEEERRLGRLAGKNYRQQGADQFVPTEGTDWVMEIGAGESVTICPPATSGNRFPELRGYLQIGEDGAADWGEGFLFPDGIAPTFAVGGCYLLEFLYHPAAGKWCVRCTELRAQSIE